MKKNIGKLIDKYLKIPLVFDTVFVLIIFNTIYKFHFLNFKLINLEGQLNIISNIISTCISLAGFILAALTIIVTFKSNLQAKGVEESENALELIFSTHHYKSIIKVFKECIIELTLTSLFLYIVWLLNENIAITTISNSIISSILTVSLACVRTLYVLFSIMNLENYRRGEQE